MALASEIARTILDGFDKHYRLFREESAAARQRFAAADWQAVREAGPRRIGMYDQRVREAVSTIAIRFPLARKDERLWPEVKRAYIDLLYDHRQPECAETFYNSVACRVLHRRYFNNEHIFVRPAVSTEYLEGDAPTYRCYYPREEDLGPTFERILRGLDLPRPFRDLEGDVRRILRVVEERFPPGWARHFNFEIQVLASPFYRNKAAYAVGRVINGSNSIPFVVALLQDDKGRLQVDALLLDRKDIAHVLSLGRAYFMVDMDVPSAYVAFLESVLEARPRAELYMMVGLQKQGKTNFYRDLQQHLRHSRDEFIVAPGVKGMVMVVFTLPSFRYVFKVIRDWYDPPKVTDRETVQRQYLRVKYHDRVGRLSDTLEYSDVALPRERISPALMEELRRLAPSMLEEQGRWLVIRHLYIERRMIPLDLYLAQADEAQRRAALQEYGDAIRDLAAANIFPGDLLPKNFGVTRFGRVVFYDYDEICRLEECRFRALPRPRFDEEELSAEPFFSVSENDVFPEQFSTFLFPEGPTRALFEELHGDLLRPAWWVAMQQRLAGGEVPDSFPYSQEIRFSRRFDGRG